MSKLKITIKSIFKQAHASRLINFNPAESLVMPMAAAGSHRSITEFERKHFLLAAGRHHSGLMFKVMLYCGLRTGEVTVLEWQNIDFDKRRIKVSNAAESGNDRIKEPKTASGIREVPIPDEIYDELLSKRGEPFEPIFKQVRGGVRHTQTSRTRAWKSLKKEIDISMGAVFEKRKAK